MNNNVQTLACLLLTALLSACQSSPVHRGDEAREQRPSQTPAPTSPPNADNLVAPQNALGELTSEACKLADAPLSYDNFGSDYIADLYKLDIAYGGDPIFKSQPSDENIEAFVSLGVTRIMQRMASLAGDNVRHFHTDPFIYIGSGKCVRVPNPLPFSEREYISDHPFSVHEGRLHSWIEEISWAEALLEMKAAGRNHVHHRINGYWWKNSLPKYFQDLQRITEYKKDYWELPNAKAAYAYLLSNAFSLPAKLDQEGLYGGGRLNDTIENLQTASTYEEARQNLRQVFGDNWARTSLGF